MNKDLNVHELVMYAENELETHASKVSLPKLIFIHMNELNSHLIHGVQITFSFANSEWYSFPSFMCHHYVFVIQICSDSMNIKRGRKGQIAFLNILLAKDIYAKFWRPHFMWMSVSANPFLTWLYFICAKHIRTLLNTLSMPC